MPWIGRGIQIGGIHTNADWGLVLTSQNIGMPKPKNMMIDIPGGNGSIDLTQALTGGVFYSNRAGQFEFDLLEHPSKWPERLERITALIHGKKHRIILPDDPDWCYNSRLSVSSFKNKNNVGKLVIDADSEPYKLKVSKTIHKIKMENQPVTLSCENARKWVNPEFDVSKSVNVEFEGKSYLLPAGISSYSNIVFKEGENILRFTNAPGAVISVSYQEGAI
jgi:hypothetical protein